MKKETKKKTPSAFAVFATPRQQTVTINGETLTFRQPTVREIATAAEEVYTALDYTTPTDENELHQRSLSDRTVFVEAQSIIALLVCCRQHDPDMTVEQAENAHHHLRFDDPLRAACDKLCGPPGEDTAAGEAPDSGSAPSRA